MNTTETILIVDFGAQYTQLIARRIREAAVYSEIHPPQRALEVARGMKLAGIILSGGPASVYEHEAPKLAHEILDLGVPVLGICYGMQWLCEHLGGQVVPASQREFGYAQLEVEDECALLAGVATRSQVWMSHGDKVTSLPEGALRLASTESCKEAAIAIPDRKVFGVQFHPEVTHTAHGNQILRNFVKSICECRCDWNMGSFIDQKVLELQAQIGADGEVVLGLSGGVDSSVTACLVQRAVGSRQHCIFVDNGLLRHGERELVREMFEGHFQMDLHVIDARERFMQALAGVTEPEVKRKAIGHVFVDVFREQAKRFQNAHFLGQGTLYPDVIESVAAHGGPTATIKTHHNVGGLPEDLEMELVEPLRELFKDEVRKLGELLGLPTTMVQRQPFPGPGLAVRILGEVTLERCAILRDADRIVTDEIENAGAHTSLWQYFAVLLPVQTVGVMGDQRTYEQVAALRVVSSEDAMTADWAYLPRDILARISNRIINEVRGINRVVLDISSKPPATIEWE